MFNFAARVWANIQAKIALKKFKRTAKRFNSTWRQVDQKLKDANVSRAKRRQIIRDIIKGNLPDFLQ